MCAGGREGVGRALEIVLKELEVPVDLCGCA